MSRESIVGAWSAALATVAVSSCISNLDEPCIGEANATVSVPSTTAPGCEGVDFDGMDDEPSSAA